MHTLQQSLVCICPFQAHTRAQPELLQVPARPLLPAQHTHPQARAGGDTGQALELSRHRFHKQQDTASPGTACSTTRLPQRSLEAENKSVNHHMKQNWEGFLGRVQLQEDPLRATALKEANFPFLNALAVVSPLSAPCSISHITSSPQRGHRAIQQKSNLSPAESQPCSHISLLQRPGTVWNMFFSKLQEF